jgi:[ribosomal protein S5]-alanine N-acetyltransferase
MSTPEVYIRLVEARDQVEFLGLMQASRALHEPWIAPPLTRPAFLQYLSRMRQPDHEGLLVCREHDDAIVGVVNINTIVRGSFLSANLGYYAGEPYASAGYMTAGLKQVVTFAFDNLGLHRLEANIQPTNQRSIALVKRCGFTREGFSPEFLFIAGAWRDHERWAILDRRDTLHAR